MNDILFRNVSIVDGTGQDAFVGDVRICDGKIVSVDKRPTERNASEIIDGSGLTLSPGFIDTHGHSDLFTGFDTQLSYKLEQGITSEICGQCGLGPAPITENNLKLYEAYYTKLGAPVHPRAAEFGSFGQYLNEMECTPTGINLAYFVPHGTLRIAAMGLSPDKPNENQLAVMKILLHEAMKEGALGLSTGLMYAPGAFADEQELTELVQVVGMHDGIYTSHMRNQADHLTESIEETIRIARNGGARANVSHHKASGEENWGRVQDSCRIIQQTDIPVTHDVYPYTAASTTIWGTVPPSLQRMGQESFLNYISDKHNIASLKKAIYEPEEAFDNVIKTEGFSNMLILTAGKTPWAEGKTIEECARVQKSNPFDIYIKLMIDNELSVTYAGFEMSESDVQYLIADKKCMFGTDGLYMPGMTMTHPRAIGSFPRILGRYVREKKILSLSEAIYKMTGFPAETYRLHNKGRIAPGYDADLVLFDAEKIIDHADFTNPLAPNEGIERVYVGGQMAVANGKCTGLKNGKTIRPQK